MLISIQANPYIHIFTMHICINITYTYTHILWYPNIYMDT